MNKTDKRLQALDWTRSTIHHKKDHKTKQYGTFKKGILHKTRLSKNQHLCLLNMAEKSSDVSHHYSLNSNSFNKKITLRKIKKKHRKVQRKKVASQISSGLYSAALYMHSVALSTVNSLNIRHIIKYKATIGSGTFLGVFKVLRGVSVVTQTISLLGQTTTFIKKLSADIAMRHKRRKVHAILARYDPETKTMQDVTANRKELNKLKRLVRQNNTNLVRTQKQIIADKLLEIKSIVLNMSAFIESTMLFVYRFAPAVAPVLPGIGVVVSSLFFIKSLFCTGAQISALNNLAHATSATSDPLLLALSGHIKQERTLKARKESIKTAVNALNVGANVSLALTGELISIVASIGLNVTTMIAMNAFNTWHQHQNEKKHKAFERLPSNSKFDLSLATKNISVAEAIFLHRLRAGSGKTLKTCIKFLRDLGVSESSIKQLQLSSKNHAAKILKNLLYNDKLQYKGLQLGQTGKTLLHVSGVSAAGRRIKNGSKWLAHKLHSASGKSVVVNTLLSFDRTNISTKKSSVATRPSLLHRFIQHQRGYALLVNEASDE